MDEARLIRIENKIDAILEMVNKFLELDVEGRRRASAWGSSPIQPGPKMEGHNHGHTHPKAEAAD